MNKKLTVFFLGIISFSLFASGCASTGNVRNEQVVHRASQKYPPFTGKVKIYWKDHLVPNPRTYEVIAIVSAMPFWAGIYEAKTYEPLHKHIEKRAAELGGNGVIMYCGEIGTVGQGTCYGEVIWLK